MMRFLGYRIQMRTIRIRSVFICLVIFGFILLFLNFQYRFSELYKCTDIHCGGTEIELKGETREKMNKFQLKIGREFIFGIEKSVAAGTKLIVDIGCGQGEVTKTLSAFVPLASKILAFDIDPKVIATAQGNQQTRSSKAKLDFFVDNIGKKWETLSSKLRTQEIQVDLIWSNLALQFIPVQRRARAILNLLRLLRPGGSFYLNILLGQDLIGIMEAEYRPKFTRVMKIPPYNKQTDVWQWYLRAFDVSTNSTISSMGARVMEKKLELQNDEKVPFTRDYLRMYRAFLTSDLSSKAKNNILEDLYVSLKGKFRSRTDRDGKESLTYYVLSIDGMK